MTWWRKILGSPEPGDELNKSKEPEPGDELNKSKEPELGDELNKSKEPEPEETLEEWRKKVEDERLKMRGSKLNESPYTTYFFKYCVYCHNFSPETCCFSKEGNNYVENLSTCSKVRLNMKKLDGRK